MDGFALNAGEYMHLIYLNVNTVIKKSKSQFMFLMRADKIE